ncbi:hypothetical protein HHK36_015042 [Tetracentron sinense]|uniref:Proteasome maturation factor UMP1 n=1 Tax=Tetracentron sinense TaxID=13715 RepID=A0A834Z430_TETSI|nr:hypothetical protein HHK36_015042 [Tetracentron sinense]
MLVSSQDKDEDESLMDLISEVSRRRRKREMENSKTIAHEIGGIQNDALRFGLQGVKSEIVGSHPFQSAHESTKKTQEEMKRRILSNTYGTAFPLKMDLDRQILSRYEFQKKLHPMFMGAFGRKTPMKLRLLLLSRFTHLWNAETILILFQRPPGAIPSSMLGLEALTGDLDNFGFEDYLNDPRDSETFLPADTHHGMEVRLGLSKGPVCPSFI